MRLARKILLGCGVVALGAFAGAVAGQRTQADATRSDEFLRRYTEVLSLVLEHAPVPVAADELVYSSLDGMLEVLDPHTNFLRPEFFTQMRERQQGSFHGIGVIISIRGGRITVISPIEGTPAARLGLRPGDVIETVDGESTEGLDIDDVARRLRGPEGTTVKVTISRPGLSEPIALTIERARVPTDSVRYAFLIKPDTAYIRVSDFTRTTGDEARRALDTLQKQGATRLLLDLRDNPGGIVDSAVEVASLLLKGEQQVFATKGRTADSFQDYRVRRDGLHFEGPVVVLVNRGSASAAEIVAGAVQDHDRGLVVGETTFGKGVVQTIYPVRDAALALTTAKYYTPSGRCIQRDFGSFFDYVHPDAPETGETENRPTPPPSGDVYFTDAGRKVYGGGGIVPDHETHLAEYSERLARLVGSSAFFRFAVSELADVPDKGARARSFVVDDAALTRFRDLVVREKWLKPEEIDAALGDATDRRDISTALKGEMLNVGTTLIDGYKAFTDADQQIQAALGLFDEAARLYARVHSAPSTETTAAGALTTR